MSENLIGRVLLVILLLVPSSYAFSEDISYSYVQATYVHTTIDLSGSIDDVEGDGFGFSLSLDINPNLAFTLSVISTTFKTFQGIEVDNTKMTDLGITAHTDITPKTDIFANLSLTKAEITVPDSSSSDNDKDYGSIFSIGLRHMMTKGFELELGASNTEVFDTTTFEYNLDARVYFRKVFSLGFGYISSDNADSFLLNIRMDV